MPSGGDIGAILTGFIGGIGEHGQKMQAERRQKEDAAMQSRMADLQRLASMPDISENDRNRYLQEADQIFQQMIGGGKGKGKGGGQGHFTGFFNQILEKLGGGGPQYQVPQSGGGMVGATPPFVPQGSAASQPMGQPQGAGNNAPQQDQAPASNVTYEGETAAPQPRTQLPPVPGSEAAQTDELKAPVPRPLPAIRPDERPSQHAAMLKEIQAQNDREWDVYEKRLLERDRMKREIELAKVKSAEQLKIKNAEWEAKSTLDLDKLAHAYLAEGWATTMEEARAMAAPTVIEAATAKVEKDQAQVQKWQSDAENTRKRIQIAQANLSLRMRSSDLQERKQAFSEYKLASEDGRKFIENLDAQIAKLRGDTNARRALMQTYMGKGGLTPAEAEKKAAEEWERSLNGLKEMREQMQKEMQSFDAGAGQLPPVPGSQGAGAARTPGQTAGKVRQVTRGLLLKYAQAHTGGDIDKARQELEADAASKGIKIEIVPGK